MINFSEMLPKMLFGDELRQRLTCLPTYDPSIKDMDEGTRLLKLMDLYKIFIPNNMAIEIYHKLYMMTSMSLAQKGTINSIKQMNANHKWTHGGEFHGIASGATSATIIGNSGIGKTSCIQSSVELIGGIIETKNPYHKIIPIIIVSTPFDCNYKGLLCQILISIDEVIGTNYYEKSQKSTMNAQQTLGLVCQLCHLYVGTLIIDEIQFLVEHKSGKQLYRMILQLINASCINVLLVGTNECVDFFKQAPQMARRSLGLQYGPMEYDKDFHNLCEILWSYQYTKNSSTLSEGLIAWLYEHTNGNNASLVSLVHDAQEIAILSGRENLCIESLTEAYTKRMQMLHEYIAPRQVKHQNPKPKVMELPAKGEGVEEVEEMDVERISYEETSIKDMVARAKGNGEDIVAIMREYFEVVEVAI